MLLNGCTHIDLWRTEILNQPLFHHNHLKHNHSQRFLCWCWPTSRCVLLGTFTFEHFCLRVDVCMWFKTTTVVSLEAKLHLGIPPKFSTQRLWGLFQGRLFTLFNPIKDFTNTYDNYINEKLIAWWKIYTHGEVS